MCVQDFCRIVDQIVVESFEDKVYGGGGAAAAGSSSFSSLSFCFPCPHRFSRTCG